MPSAYQLDRYRYISDLGRGGMSHVVLAEDVRLGRRVALKQMNATGDAEALLRLRREALIGASVSHANLVSIYDIVAAGGGEYVIVMEYVDGETLRDRLAGGRALPSAEVLGVLDGVAAGLDAIHAHGIVHRDVKPGNILLASNGDVKLADLGIASAPDRTRITADGVILGTFGYMAPEQIDGKPASSATDVYALAAVAYEALSGRKARTETNPVVLAHAIVTQPALDLRAAWPDAPAEAAELLIRAMAAEPASRPSSASELTQRLREALERRPTVPLKPVAAGPKIAPPPASGGPTRTPPGTDLLRASSRGAGRRSTERAGAASATAGPPAARELNPQQAVVADGPTASFRGPSAASIHRSRRGRLLAPFGLLLVAVIVGVLLTSGGRRGKLAAQGNSPHHSTKSGHHATGVKTGGSASASASGSSASASASTPNTSAGGGSAQAPPPGPSPSGGASASTPTSATESFYSLAAAHHYPEAWALADPTFQAQLGGYRSFEAGQALDRSITFDRASVVTQTADSATVAVRTTSVRENGTQHCTGTVELRHASSIWMLHLIHISCA